MSDELEEALPAAIRAWDRVRRPNEQRHPFSAGFRAGWAARSARLAALEKVAEEARNAIKTGGFPSLTDRLVELDAVTAADTGNGEA